MLVMDDIVSTTCGGCICRVRVLVRRMHPQPTLWLHYLIILCPWIEVDAVWCCICRANTRSAHTTLSSIACVGYVHHGSDGHNDNYYYIIAILQCHVEGGGLRRLHPGQSWMQLPRINIATLICY